MIGVLRKDGGSDDGRPPGDLRSEPSSNDTRASTSDPYARLYRESYAARAAELTRNEWSWSMLR